ncbi:alternative ribosome rescue aminoacyl-tRNA hydrolase ArfB [Nocardioides ultimimeridianus]
MPGELDLRIDAGPGAPDGLIVPAAELVERFSRSSGPGGQSVNTADSRVQLELSVETSGAFSDAQRRRVLDRLGPVVAVTASEHRSQHRNRVAARERLATLIRDALAPLPPTRRPTRPGRGAKERRLQAKRERSETKSLRGQVRDD